jgi:hypothetical protein
VEIFDHAIHWQDGSPFGQVGGLLTYRFEVCGALEISGDLAVENFVAFPILEMAQVEVGVGKLTS